MREILSLFGWTFVFAVSINKANRDLGKLSGKIYILHVFLAWLLLARDYTGFQMLSWAVFHPRSIAKYFFIQVGPLPPWFNLLTWAGSLICSIASISLALCLAKRKEMGRVWVLRLAPHFLLILCSRCLERSLYERHSYSLIDSRFCKRSAAINPFWGNLFVLPKRTCQKVYICTMNRTDTANPSFHWILHS